MGKPKRWEIGFSREGENEEIQALAAYLGKTELTASLLYHRGYRTIEAAKEFLSLQGTYFHDPFLLKDMDLAVRRLNEAIEAGEKICVWGDYDADGVTATATLVSYLTHRSADVEYFIPDRFRDGYGMNERAVVELAQRGVKLIVTVDNGIVATGPIARAYELGMEVIVTDHHEPQGELPKACAVINPHRQDCPYPFKQLAGVGVAFKLICATEIAYKTARGEQFDYMNDLCVPYLDLVAIGTVADVMQLVGENRLIVSMGLDLIARRPRVGVDALLVQASGKGKKINTQTVGFVIAPRINAAGRLASASLALELLLCKEEDEANRRACELCDLNRDRQNEENEIFEQAVAQIDQIGAQNDSVLVLYGEKWHSGIIGIVASRMTERFSRPCLMIGEVGGVGKGSGRSVEGVNLFELLLGCSEHLIQFGGHEKAAGVSVEKENLTVLRRAINTLFAEKYPDGIPEQTMRADCEITLSDVTERQIRELSILEPCGEGNPQPIFVIRNLTVAHIASVGSGRHTRISFKQGKRTVNAMYFGVGAEQLAYREGDVVDAVVQMDLNEFGGYVTPQLLVRDMDVSLGDKQNWDEMQRAVTEFLSGRDDAIERECFPNRADLVRVYQYLRARGEDGEETVQPRRLSALLFSSSEQDLIRLGLSLTVFSQLGIVLVRPCEPCVADTGTKRMTHLALTLPKTQKMDLQMSECYRRMQSAMAGAEKGEEG